jgi:DNA-binding NarL/FixJ family response regulator
VARRLSISLRTCRRHVAEILDQLDSSGRFQAGVGAVPLGAVPAQHLAALD